MWLVCAWVQDALAFGPRQRNCRRAALRRMARGDNLVPKGCELLDYDVLFTRLEEVMEKSWMQELLREERGTPNFWSIVEYGSHSYENRYSRMLRWLLDPHANHGLGRLFLLRLVGIAARKSAGASPSLLSLLKTEEGRFTPVDGDGAKVEVRGSNSDRADLHAFAKSLGLCLVVENKMGSSEGTRGEGSQLDLYERSVVESENYRDYQHKVFVFLTIDGSQPKAGGGSVWLPVSYEEVSAPLEEFYRELGNSAKSNSSGLGVRSSHAQKIVGDFIQDIRAKFQYLRRHKGEIEQCFGEYGAELEALLVSLGRPRGDIGVDMGWGHDDCYDLGEAFQRRFPSNSHEAITAVGKLVEGLQLGSQNHEPNLNVQVAIRMLFNHFAGREVLDLNDHHLIGAEQSDQRSASTGEGYRNRGISEVLLTRGKGQGIRLKVGSPGFFLYLSGDASGAIPNDYFTLQAEDSRTNVLRVLGKNVINVAECKSHEEIRRKVETLVERIDLALFEKRQEISAEVEKMNRTREGD